MCIFIVFSWKAIVVLEKNSDRKFQLDERFENSAANIPFQANKKQLNLFMGWIYYFEHNFLFFLEEMAKPLWGFNVTMI